MRSEPDTRDCLTAILENIARIERYVAGIDRQGFSADARTADAVERCLERICEAAVRLGEMGPQLMPAQPWRDIRGMGNWFRHAYDRIDLAIVWLTVEKRLPALKADVERALAGLSSENGLEDTR